MFAAGSRGLCQQRLGHYPRAKTDVEDDILEMEITAKTERLVTYYYITTLMLGQWGDQGVVMGPVFAVHTPSQGGGGPGGGGRRTRRGTRPVARRPEVTLGLR